MTDASSAGPIERVVVRLDAASESRAAIDTAARLAARAKAPLHGIFVEDEDFLNLAGLPFARQVTLGGGAEPLTTEQAALHLRAAAERARRELAAAATRHRVAWSFAIARGATGGAATHASERDLVVAGALSRPIAGHFRLESHCWSELYAARGPFLLARHAWHAGGSLVILLRDRGDASARLIEAAAQIAHAGDNALTVISPPAIAGARGFQKWLAERLAGTTVRVQVEIAPDEPTALPQRLAELDCRLLAIEAGLAEGGVDRLREFVERLACDVLVVR